MGYQREVGKSRTFPDLGSGIAAGRAGMLLDVEGSETCCRSFVSATISNKAFYDCTVVSASADVACCRVS